MNINGPKPRPAAGRFWEKVNKRITFDALEAKRARCPRCNAPSRRMTALWNLSANCVHIYAECCNETRETETIHNASVAA